ncbi:MAG TPA: WYL domain-containing protein [Acidimicrobiales bacterium]|nr:WYL domain-containing protein [Acidimicrobiales bacterium]
MHRLERLINLVAALLESERPLTIDELRFRLPGYAENDGAFRRAFERDKEALRELGVPLVTEPLDPLHPGVEGYRIPKDAYYLRDPGLEQDELAALHLAASAVRMEGADGVAALWKLGGELAEEGPAAAVASVAVAALPGADHLAVLFGAISARRPVEFAYHGRPRRLDPYRLSFRNGHWYLAGFDHGAGAERSFRLDRVESEVTASGEAGSFPPAPAAAAVAPAWEMGEGEAVEVRLLVDVEQAGWAIGFVGPDAVEERRPDGSVVLRVSVTNRPAFRSFVLGFLDHAEVLGPPELRAEMVEWLEAQCST